MRCRHTHGTYPTYFGGDIIHKCNKCNATISVTRKIKPPPKKKKEK